MWESLEAAEYSVLPIAITPSGHMIRYDGSPGDLRSQQLPVVGSGTDTATFVCDPAAHGLIIDGAVEKVDAVFPVLHGPWGEDGTIQGWLELANLPYVGSGVLASALCMDKSVLKTVLRASDIPVCDWVAIDNHGWTTRRDELINACQQLGDVVFVKPARAGSSLGISRVQASSEDPVALVSAIEAAREHDPRVIVEAAAVGAREIECGVRQRVDGSIEASVCAEIVVREGFDFYDFEAKYISDGAHLVVPAEVSPEQAENVADLARRCFVAAGCEGLARVDFFLTDSGLLVNEINTMPGFTPISMFPRMWEASGVAYSSLVDELVQQALARNSGLR
jgi:D-alanine-D-alanine ligase